MNDRWNGELSSISLMREAGLTPESWGTQGDRKIENIVKITINDTTVFEEIVPSDLEDQRESYTVDIVWKHDGYNWWNSVVVYKFDDIVLWIVRDNSPGDYPLQLDTIFTFSRHDYESEIPTSLLLKHEHSISKSHLDRFFACVHFCDQANAIYLIEDHSSGRSPCSALRELNAWRDDVFRDSTQLRIAKTKCFTRRSRVSIGLDMPGYPECQFEVGIDQSGEKVLRLLANPWFPIPLEITPTFPWTTRQLGLDQ